MNPLRWIDGVFSDEATAAQVRHQQVTLLFQASLIALPIGIIAALVICVVFWNAVPVENLVGWALACVAITIVRGFQLRAFRRDTRSLQNSRRWLRQFVGVSSIHTIILSAANFVIFPQDLTHQLLLVIMIIGIASGGAITLTAHLPSSFLYATIILAPLAVRFFVEENLPILFGPMTIVYIGLLVSTSRDFTKVLRRLLGLQTELRDVIASKEQAEQALKKQFSELDKLNIALSGSEARQRAIIENAPFGIALRDLDGRHIVANSKYFDIYTTPSGGIIGRTLDDVFPPQLSEGQSEIDQIVRTKRETVVRERHYDTPAGTNHFLEVGFPIFDAQDSLTSVGSLAIDVSDRVQLEERLRQSQKMEAIGSLTGGVAHEFNNLLMVIRGNLDLIAASTELDGRLAEFVKRSLRGVDRGADLTQRLLSFARKHPVQPQICDVNELVAGEIPMLEQALGEKWQITATYAETAALTKIDPRQVEQGILNLVLNARDAMSGGGEISIQVSPRSIDQTDARDLGEDVIPGRYVVLSISDSGTGIDEPTLSRVFEPFFTTKDVGDGTGLGLSMVYGFAKQSGGHAEINSTPGTGTTVRLYLPEFERGEDQNDEVSDRGVAELDKTSAPVSVPTH